MPRTPGRAQEAGDSAAIHKNILHALYINRQTWQRNNILCVSHHYTLRGRSQLSTFMKAYTAYTRGEGIWDHRMLSPRKSTFICNHWQCIIKYCTCLECGQYAHIWRSFMYNNNFEALFLTSKCTKRGFLWTQTVASHRGFCKAAQRRYRIFSTWADSSSQNRTKLRIFH